MIIKGSLSGGCENPYIALRIDNKNLFFLKNRPVEAYYSEKQKDFLFSHLVWREKEELDNLLKKNLDNLERSEKRLSWKRR